MAFTRTELLYYIETKAKGDWRNIESIVADNNGVFRFGQYHGVPGCGVDFIDEEIPGGDGEYLTGFLFYYLPSAPYRKTDFGAVRNESVEWFVNVSDIMGISVIPDPIPSYVTPQGGFPEEADTDVTASITNQSATGFTVVLSEEVEGLGVPNFKIKNGNSTVTINSIQTIDSITYVINAPITKGYEYEVIISKKGFNFGEPLQVSIPADPITFTIEEIHTKGFKVSLSESVNLFAHRINVTGETGNVVATNVIKVGEWYHVTIQLKEGQQYSISISVPGYEFGPPQNITVPYTISGNYTVDGQTDDGFFINFDVDVNNITLENVKLAANGTNISPVSITKINNQRYRVDAQLIVGSTHYLYVSKVGYNLPRYTSFHLAPAPVVTASVSNVTLEGFEINLSVPVTGLTVSNIILTNEEGPVTISLSELNGGSRYSVQADLNPGDEYVLNIDDSWHIFNSDITFTTPTLGVTKTVSNISINSFRVNLNPAVDGLTVNDFTLLRGTTPVTITSITSVNGGQYYTVNANLQYDQSYTISIEKEGIEFGNPVTFNAPATTVVAATISNITPTGFRINMSPAVSGMTTAHMTLTQDGNTITITNVTAVGGGSSYDVAVPLQRGVTYSLNITRAGYNFGGVKNIPVPIENVALTVSNVNINNFTVSLNAAVPGLVAGDFILMQGSTPVSITNVATSNGGASYVLTAALQYDQSYTITANKPGYNFGAVVPFNAPATTVVTTTISNITPTGFRINMSPAVSGMTAAHMTLTQDGGNVTISSITAVGGGASYDVVATLQRGVTYNLAIARTGYNFGENKSIPVPIENVTLDVTTVNINNFTVTLNAAVPGLVAGDFTLLNGSTPVTITGASTSNGGASYVLTAALQYDESYTVTATKSGYNFGAPVAFNAPATVTVSKAVSSITPNGFVISFTPSVPGLTTGNFTLLQGGTPVAITNAVTSNSGASYTITAEIDYETAYTINASRTGYNFGAATGFNGPAITAVTGTVDEATTESITITFDPAVTGLTADNFEVLFNSSPFEIDSVSDLGGGSYTIVGTFVAGDEYEINVTEIGYSFNNPLVAVIPE